MNPGPTRHPPQGPCSSPLPLEFIMQHNQRDEPPERAVRDNASLETISSNVGAQAGAPQRALRDNASPQRFARL